MNDTFSFHAPAEVFRRRLDARWVRIGIVGLLVVVAMSSFARWVVASERTADLRREAALTALRRPASSSAPAPVEDDDLAKAAATTALTIARGVFAETGSFSDASTAVLAAEQPDLIFVDGPSAAPAIVSVDARPDAWSAAVMGDAGCVWVAVTADGLIRYGDGTECTGTAAAAADRATW